MNRICFIAQRYYRDTIERLWKLPLDVKVELMSYDLATRVPFLCGIPTVFTDMDRLGKIDLAEASRVYSKLEAAGVPVFNDPSKVLTRFSMLKKLANESVNDLRAPSPTHCNAFL